MPSTELLLFIVNKLGLDYKISVLIVCFLAIDLKQINKNS